jgi:hypothetical protein
MISDNSRGLFSFRSWHYRNNQCNYTDLCKSWEYFSPEDFISSTLPSYRVDRVLGFFSSRPNWDHPPHPLDRRRARVCPPFAPGGGGQTRLREKGWEVPIRTRGQTLWYSMYMFMYFVISRKFYYKFATLASLHQTHREKKDYEWGKRGSHYYSFSWQGAGGGSQFYTKAKNRGGGGGPRKAGCEKLNTFSCRAAMFTIAMSTKTKQSSR